MTGWQLALAVLATFRVSHLVTSDFIAEPVRSWVENRYGKASKRGYMVTCNWCISIWLSVPVALVAVLWINNRVILIGLLALAASALTGVIATVLDMLQSFTDRNDASE